MGREVSDAFFKLSSTLFISSFLGVVVSRGQRDLRLLGPPPGQGADVGARIRDRRIPCRSLDGFAIHYATDASVQSGSVKRCAVFIVKNGEDQ
ncbi:hypothetical protein PoB_001775000 [Plakobranchus ocellatus]|uniref:Secreted protein n=1 Tax=Plakobranchus ocellatus TaxID=259542 RepID=A0AAV3Z7W3_9GAST|nr:hypothetical protein PoB_001775000 [Plakobranchus ocellatus]